MLKNKVAVITGGTRGIGFAIAELFLKNGAKVAVLGSRKETVDKALEKLSGEVMGLYPDLTDYNAVEAAFAEIKAKFGEYANPSFESQVETVSKARSGGVMSIRTAVDEMYGDSRDEDWKNEEERRIKEENGITVLPETSALDDVTV